MANWKNVPKNEKGFSLIEVLVSLALLGIISAGFLGGLGTASKAFIITDERETAKNLAESQMEYLKKQGYALSYSPAQIPPEYNGYSATIDVSNVSGRDDNIQKIVVTIWHQSKEVKKLEGFKVN